MPQCFLQVRTASIIVQTLKHPALQFPTPIVETVRQFLKELLHKVPTGGQAYGPVKSATVRELAHRIRKVRKANCLGGILEHGKLELSITLH